MCLRGKPTQDASQSGSKDDGGGTTAPPPKRKSGGLQRGRPYGEIVLMEGMAEVQYNTLYTTIEAFSVVLSTHAFAHAPSRTPYTMHHTPSTMH
jgi:hypothetical protein